MIIAALMPPRSLDTNSRTGELAIPNSASDKANTSMPMTIIRFLPNLSDNLPASGEKSSCISEKAATSKPTIPPVMPKLSMNLGIIGIITSPMPVKTENKLSMRIIEHSRHLRGGGFLGSCS